MRIDHEHAIGSQHMLAQLMAIAFPITLGAAVSGLAKMIDLGLIMRRLQDAGMDHNSAVSLYGCYSAMVAPLYHAVPALFGSITMPLIPHLSHAIANHDRKEQAELLDTTFRLTATISIPASFGMGLLCEQILRLLYGNTTEIMTAIPLLLVMSMAIPAACLITSTSAILQAYGHAWIPMISTLIGCALKAGVLYALAGMPSIGIMSAPISTLVCCSVIVLINMVCISKIVPEDSFSKPWVGAAAASLVSIGVAALVKRMMMEKCDSLIMIVIVTMASAISLYAILAFKFGLLRISDIKPKEKKEQQNNGNSRKDSESSVQEGIQL